MAISIHLSPSEQALLQQIHRKRSVPEYQKERLQIVLAAAGMSNKDIAAQHGIERHRVTFWQKRWATHHHARQESDESLRPAMNESLVLLWLADQKGRGRKDRITAEQRTKIAALSLETPEQNGLPVTHWTLEHLTHFERKNNLALPMHGGRQAVV